VVKNKRFKSPVYVIGSGHASQEFLYAQRKDISRNIGTEIAAKQAFEQAGLGPKDIDVAEVHDCLTINQVIAIESLGFFERGRGQFAAVEGDTLIGGKIPVNMSGGLKSRGHPIGATGVYQIAEIVEQLRGDAGKRQVKGAEIGLTQNIGGTGTTATVHIFRRK